MASQKVCVVTGGNKGIGFAIVKELCKKFDGTVYLTSRDEERGRAAIQALEKEGLSPKFHQLDIENQNSINIFAAYIKTTYKGLDALVNNAGFAYKNNSTESFGIQAENTIKINYFSTKNLCHALFPLLRPHARVSNVSSYCGHLSLMKGKEPEAGELRNNLSSESLKEIELDEMMSDFIRLAKDNKWEENGWPASTYVVSKVGLSALTRIQQREFDTDSREDLVVNSCHPGYVDTDMSSHKGPLTIEQGAVCPVYLALLPLNTDIKGLYLGKNTEVVDWVTGKIEL